MNFEFERVSVSDVCELIVDCVNKTAPKVEHKTQFKMIRTPNIRNGVINLDRCNYVSEETYEKWTRRATVEKDDVLLTREAPMGEVGIIDFEDTVFLGQRIMQYRANKSKLCPRFLLYSFLSSDLKNQFYQHEGSGSVVSHIRVPDCLKFEINLPPLKIQRKISSFLWGIDQKIKNSNNVNQTLEQMAQALFKSWFVDFEPVKAKITVLEAGGSQEDATLAAMMAISGKDIDALVVFEREHPEQYAELKATADLFPSAMQESELGVIPEGWMVNPTSAHYNISIGKTPPRKETQWFSTANGDLKWVSIKDMGIASTYIAETSERLTHEAVKKFNIKVMPADTVFLSFKLTVGRVCITTEDMCSNEAIAHFTPKENKYKNQWLYHALHSFDFNKLGSTSSIATAVNSKTIRDMQLIFPNEIISQKYTEKVSSLMQLQKLNTGQTNSLTQLRDTLLPKLLSGEITLPDAEQAVSEAEDV
ncbi:restriction endonuclease subunit S [Serratia marcescens]|nr:restriction endonuclease subunit S [Serratia marcescens]